MMKVALTGSIGMGKSTVGRMLTARGIALFDADAAVHALYAPGGAAVEPLRAAFPEAVGAAGVDRAILSKLVLGDGDAIRRPALGRAACRERVGQYVWIWGCAV